MEYFNMMRKKVLGLTDAQDFVREATNNEQWGPTSKQHQQIIQYTYHYQECTEVMGYIYRRLGEDGKNWRTIYKALLVLDNILKNGSEEAVNIALTRTVEVKTLTSFQKIDENGKDVGINVRERSKQIMELLNDKDYLRQTRDDAKKQKKDYSGVGNSSSYSSSTFNGSSSTYNNSAFDDDFDSFGKSSSQTYGGYSDQPEKKEEPQQESYQDAQPEEPQQEEKQEEFSFGGPGSYKDQGYQTSYKQPKQQSQQPRQIQQVQQPKPQQSVNLFDFGAPQQQVQQPQQQSYQTSANLFDMLDAQPQAQQPMQRQQPQMQQRQQQSSASLFDFGTPSQPQQPMQQSYGQPRSQAVYGNGQLNTMDLFSGMTMPQSQPMQQPVQQPQQQQQSSFDFGDFSSAPAAQPKQNDWRANIRVDSLADTRKQPQQKPQQQRTLGSFL